MEWQGLNLTNWRERRWCKKVIYSLKVILLSLLLTLLVAYWIISQAITQQQEITMQQTHLISIKEKLEKLNQTISLLSKSQFEIKQNLLSSSQITTGLSLIYQAPISGWLENLQIYIENEFTLKIDGYLTQQQFEILEQYFKSQTHIQYHTEHFQINDKKQIETTLIIRLIENEK